MHRSLSQRAGSGSDEETEDVDIEDIHPPLTLNKRITSVEDNIHALRSDMAGVFSFITEDLSNRLEVIVADQQNIRADIREMTSQFKCLTSTVTGLQTDMTALRSDATFIRSLL